MVGFAGLMVMAVIVLVLTVRVAVPVALPDFAVMLVVPSAIPVACPLVLMTATVGEDDCQDVVEVMSPVVLLP